MKQEYRAGLPAVSPKQVAVALTREIPAYFTPEEVKAILQSARTPRDHLLINLLWQTGARISELLALKVEDIDFYAKTVRLPCLKRKKRPYRVLPLKDGLIGELGAYIGQRGLRRDDRLFKITRERAWQIVKETCRRAGMDRERSHPHTFRHSFAVYCVLNHVPILVLKDWLGHSNIASTLVYLKILSSDTRQFYEALQF